MGLQAGDGIVGAAAYHGPARHGLVNGLAAPVPGRVIDWVARLHVGARVVDEPGRDAEQEEDPADGDKRHAE